MKQRETGLLPLTIFTVSVLFLKQVLKEQYNKVILRILQFKLLYGLRFHAKLYILNLFVFSAGLVTPHIFQGCRVIY